MSQIRPHNSIGDEFAPVFSSTSERGISHEWLVSHEDKNKAFCKTCSTHSETKAVFGNHEIGFNEEIA